MTIVQAEELRAVIRSMTEDMLDKMNIGQDLPVSQQVAAKPRRDARR